MATTGSGRNATVTLACQLMRNLRILTIKFTTLLSYCVALAYRMSRQRLINAMPGTVVFVV
jgi:hypothetical protein